MEYLNENSHRNFPIREDCPMKTTTGYRFPNEVIVDCIAYMSTGFQYEYYIKSVVYTPTEFTVVIARADTLEAKISGTISSGTVMGLSGADDSEGKIIVGSLTNLPYGAYEFEPGMSLLEPCRVIKLCTGISSLNGITSGPVNLIAGANVKFTINGTSLKIDTMDGLCACNNNPCIESINGQTGPDITISGTGCVAVTSGQNGITIENTCENSCCGCDEVNDMIEWIKTLENRVAALGG